MCVRVIGLTLTSSGERGQVLDYPEVTFLKDTEDQLRAVNV